MRCDNLVCVCKRCLGIRIVSESRNVKCCGIIVCRWKKQLARKLKVVKILVWFQNIASCMLWVHTLLTYVCTCMYLIQIEKIFKIYRYKSG